MAARKDSAKTAGSVKETGRKDAVLQVGWEKWGGNGSPSTKQGYVRCREKVVCTFHGGS